MNTDSTDTALLTEELLTQLLPHGSGIDCTWRFDARRDGGMDCHNSFHLMDENGYYDGYADFTVRIFRHAKDVLNPLKGPCLGMTQVIHRKGDVDFKIVTHGTAWRRKSAFGLVGDIYEQVSFALESVITKRHETIGAQRMVPTEHEKAEWLRCAADASARGFNDTATKFSDAALLTDMPLSQFDSLQAEYRQWLIHGFAVQIAAQKSL